MKSGNEVLSIHLRGGEGYGLINVLMKIDVPCRRVVGIDRIEWIVIEPVEVEYTAPRRTWFTDIEIKLPKEFAVLGVQCLINREPRELKTGDVLTIRYPQDHVLLSYRNV